MAREDKIALNLQTPCIQYSVITEEYSGVDKKQKHKPYKRGGDLET